jgi:putative Holliday junction resolvase
MVIMGLDVGDIRIGVAFTDKLLLAAHAYGTIDRRNEKAAIEEIARLARERKVSRIVVGMPYTLRGELGVQGDKVRRFIELLREKVDVPVVEWDERMTTAAADRLLRELEMPGRKRRKLLDQLSAALILQSYLDMLKSRGELDVEGT